MSQNGKSVSMAPSGLISPAGAPLTTMNWHPPEGKSDFFGYISPQGHFVSIALSTVSFLASDANGRFVCQMTTGSQAMLEATDGFRLMKMLGWKERTN